MKKKVSISMSEDTIAKVDMLLEGGLFRNRSHIIEFAVKSLLKNG